MGRSAAGPAGGGAVRPRYGRIASLAGSVLTTAVALLGATGVLGAATGSAAAPTTGEGSGAVVLSGFSDRVHDPGMVTPTERSGVSPAASARPDGRPDEVPALPARSGEGRRVVFSMGEQRVWLVGARDQIRRTYLVSGSLTDNLGPGSYEVYSRSRHAVGIDDSGTMEYMVRFTRGTRAAIGFHDIPVKDGELLQTRAELGTPQSSGCIRQARPDARALWEFAPVGTPVVVVG